MNAAAPTVGCKVDYTLHYRHEEEMINLCADTEGPKLP